MRRWSQTPVLPTRLWIVGVAAALGLLLAGLIFLANEEADNATEQREALERRDDRLADAIRRIEGLERLTRPEARALLRRLLRELQLTPELRRRALRVLDERGGGEAPRGGNPPPGPPGPLPPPQGDGPGQGLPPLVPDLPDLPDLPVLPELPCPPIPLVCP